MRKIILAAPRTTLGFMLIIARFA
jgi:hypothetical protein